MISKIVGVDTDVLVNWLMVGAPHHSASSRLLEHEVRNNGNQLGVTVQTLLELQHICTDARRFENPLSMAQALEWSRSIWDAKEVTRLLPTQDVLHRSIDLMTRFRLGRKRFLDTALAATMEAAGVKKLATLNKKDFEVFPFLELIVPS